MATVEVFQYPVIPEPPALWDGLGPAWAGPEPQCGTACSSTAVTAELADDASNPDREDHEFEVAQRRFEEGRRHGIQEGRQIEREALKAAQSATDKQRFEQAAVLAEQCAREQAQFLQKTEHEVVTLALAIAARILRREAQMDPLFLSGAVRVALGQLSKSSSVRLRVPPADLELWSEAMKHIPNLAVRPEVLSGEGMQTGECLVEAELGSIDLGIRAQLNEIERGFFDRASVTPANSAGSHGALRYQEVRP